MVKSHPTNKTALADWVTVLCFLHSYLEGFFLTENGGVDYFFFRSPIWILLLFAEAFRRTDILHSLRTHVRHGISRTAECGAFERLRSYRSCMHRIAAGTLVSGFYFIDAHASNNELRTNHFKIFKHSTNLLCKNFSMLAWSRQFRSSCRHFPAAGGASELAGLALLIDLLHIQTNKSLHNVRIFNQSSWKEFFIFNWITNTTCRHLSAAILSRISQFIFDHGKFYLKSHRRRQCLWALNHLSWYFFLDHQGFLFGSSHQNRQFV